MTVKSNKDKMKLKIWPVCLSGVIILLLLLISVRFSMEQQAVNKRIFFDELYVTAKSAIQKRCIAEGNSTQQCTRLAVVDINGLHPSNDVTSYSLVFSTSMKSEDNPLVYIYSANEYGTQQLITKGNISDYAD